MEKFLSGVAAALVSGTSLYAADIYQPPAEVPYVEQPAEVVQTSG
ncbi:hypothetical protein [Sinorhizobium fredii]|uniref:Uncharacterized protein n=1 Tax=Sinorhizobium fredii (strain USDA 257) TaxID=1185652 RepID=I3X5Z2_SINF2|nr:hypothetical protein [Sinorhizobium fredii]AFL51298.1 hypothetical protein USDA257_c27250 [Sinorhizobium fredii USDA 257]